MQRLLQMRMVFILMMSAIFLAIATFIGLALITSRSGPPVAEQPTVQQPADPNQGQAAARNANINGVGVTLNGNPNQEVRLLSELNPTAPPAVVIEDADVTDTPPPSQPPPPTETPVPVSPYRKIPYTVEQGDSLYSIAESQNSAIELLALNGIDDDDLVPGQTIEITVANPEFCQNARAYVVRDRETVFRIAQQFQTTLEVIKERNNLNDEYEIKATQVLCIP